MFQLGLSTLQSLSFCALAHFGSLLITIYCKQKFLKLQLTDVLIYGYNTKSLGDGLTLYPFSGIIVVDSFLGPIAYLAVSS